jgi:hypothetical protein
MKNIEMRLRRLWWARSWIGSERQLRSRAKVFFSTLVKTRSLSNYSGLEINKQLISKRLGKIFKSSVELMEGAWNRL